MKTKNTAVFTTGELARLFDCDPRTIRDMLDAQKLHGFKVGNQWRIPVTAVATLFEAPVEEVIELKKAAQG